MKSILYVLVLMTLWALAFGPACPGGVCPTPEKTKPVTTVPPPVITEPPEKTEPPPVITEPPSVTDPVETPERGATKQAPGKPEGNEPEARAIRLPQSGYGPPPAQPMSAGTMARWGALVLIGLAGIWLAAWDLKK